MNASGESAAGGAPSLRGGARLLIGDVHERMAEIPDGSIDLVLTSPPFLALRSYLPADHPDKGKEIGSEPTPADFLDTLLRLAARWRELLAPHGSIAVELGDTYAGSGGGGGDYLPGGMREGQQQFAGSASSMRESNAAHWRQKNAWKTKWDRSSGREAPGGQPYADTFKGGGPGGEGWPLDKSLCGIPHLFHLSLAYGVNLLTGEPSPAGRWRVRNVVAWCRPNPPVGALGDKVRPATSYMTIATVAKDRYFDLDAVRGNPQDVKDQRTRTTNGPKNHADPSEVLTANYRNRVPSNPAGPPPLDWWDVDEFMPDAWVIPTQAYAGSHYATWPMALCERPIKAMVPHRVCTTCGKPSRRITADADAYTEVKAERPDVGDPLRNAKSGDSQAPAELRSQGRGGLTRMVNTLGWSDCGHDSWRLGVVLDPFAGSGTTLAAATGLGHAAIGIDLDDRNAELARQRVGMFLDVEGPTRNGAVA